MIRAADYTARQSEAAFQEQILTAARLLSWECFHAYDSRRSPPGFPDVIAIHPGPPARLVVFEVKAALGKVSPEQERWLALFAAVPGVVARCVRPRDWDEIETLLQPPS